MTILSSPIASKKKIKKRGADFTLAALIILFLPLLSQGASPLDVVINEIAWMGTKANSADEWIELYNNTGQSISLEGWGLYEAGGGILIEPLSGEIPAKSYYLIERTDNTTVSDILASQEPSSWGGSGLNNGGEYLALLDQNSTRIDEVNGWFGGEASPNYKTMERKDTQKIGNDQNNWATNNGSAINGHDAEGNAINGTPGAQNSVIIMSPEPTPSPTPSPTPEATNSLTPSPTPFIAPTPTATTVPITLPPSYPSGVIFSEILPSPNGPDETDEWIELFNKNNFEVDLSGWQITDTIGTVTKYIFPITTKMGPEQFLVLSRPQTDITLNNSEDGLKLIQPNGKILDDISYQDASLGNSYIFIDGRWAWSSALTPGATNVLSSGSREEKTMPAAEKNNLSSTSAEKQLASAEKQILGSKNPLPPFLVALALAIISGISILFFKKKVKEEN